MNDSDLTRREVLSSLAVAGGAGAFAGRGTVALFSDGESDGVAFTAGAVDLIVETQDGGKSEGGVTVPVTLTDDDGDGVYTDETRLTVSPKEDTNPVYAWMGATCPDPGAVARDLEVEISREGSVIHSRTLLDEIAEGGGIALGASGDSDGDDQRCLDDDVTLTLRWRLEDADEDYRATSAEFVFVGQQCRHNDPSNPIPERDCPVCECCVRTGKLDLDDVTGVLEAGSTYRFSEGSDDYEITIVETETKDEGSEDIAAQFEVVGVDGTPDPRLCRVEIAGGPNDGDNIRRYDLRDTTGNDTGELLYAPSKDESEDYYGISSITVSLCAEWTESGCPDDRVQPRGES